MCDGLMVPMTHAIGWQWLRLFHPPGSILVLLRSLLHIQ